MKLNPCFDLGSMTHASKLRVGRASRHRLTLATLLAGFGLFLGTGGHLEAQGSTIYLAYSDFINQVISGTPSGGAVQAEAVALFSGVTGSATAIGTPSDGTYYLSQVAFGQNIASTIRRPPDLSFGQGIEVGVSDLIPAEADPSYAPVVDPGLAAFYVDSVDTLFFAEPGFVTVTWKNNLGNDLTPSVLLVSSLPYTNMPFRIYWTHTNAVPTGAPGVDFSSGPQPIIHHNSAITPSDLWLDSDVLYASSVSGLALLEYRERGSGNFLGVAPVDVRPFFPDAVDTIDIGEFLAPHSVLPPADQSRALVTRGLADSPPYARQLTTPSTAATDGQVFAVRPASGGGDHIEVFWTRLDTYGVVWPHEMDRYDAVWPAEFADISRRAYETHSLAGTRTKAPLVEFPEPPVSITLHYNDVIGPDRVVIEPNLRQLYSTNAVGRVLIEYANTGTSDFLGLEYVELVSYYRDYESATFVGSQLLPVVEPADAVIPLITRGQNTNPDYAYQHPTAGSMEGYLFAVRRTTALDQIEIFWMRSGVLDVEWPYEMHHYAADWPIARPDLYQRYVRAPSPVLGPDVVIPTEYSGALMPWQEPSGHAEPVFENAFYTTAPGWSLLKYTPDEIVIFQVVRSVDHHDTAFFNLSAIDWNVGLEIVEPTHQGPRPGYIHRPEGDRYDWEIYDGKPDDPPEHRTLQIIPVNVGTLEVWWSNLRHNVQWPSVVKRYDDDWPTNPEEIIIASLQGTGPIDPAQYREFRIYQQNDPNLPGFNPNDEHALRGQVASGEAIFALRDDLATVGTSEPYVLVRYLDAGDRWRYRVFDVISEKAPYFFQYPATAGTPIQPPYPLSVLVPLCEENTGVSGPYWEDRDDTLWARAAGDNGGTANVVTRFFYPVQDRFFFPGGNPPSPGDHVPWLDIRAGTPGTPHNITYVISWPAAPVLKAGETLVQSKFGLPDIANAPSVEILYQQSVALGGGPSVKVIDPTRERAVGPLTLPSDVRTSISLGKTYFPDLPPHLRTRLWYDSLDQKLHFVGEFLEVNGIEEPNGYLLLNVITDRDKDEMLALSSDGAFRAMITQLSQQAADVIEVSPNQPFVAPLAVTAGLAEGTGYVTLAINNNTVPVPSGGITVEVIKVDCPRYTGEIKVVASSNPFDEQLTMRHSGDFAGEADAYEFQWRTLPPLNGVPQTHVVPENWTLYTTEGGAVDITIRGAGLFTLTDNYFICRYHPLSAGDPCGDTWSEWTEPQLAEGWIKRVLKGVNGFEQTFKDFENIEINTTVSMISQAGARWTGNVPLTQEAASQSGLIEVYESILRRGIELSIEGAPPVDYPPANDALLLAAGRISDLYLLVGNDAYADAADPTIAFGTGDGTYGAEASTIHCFQNQAASLLEEELGLLRGRDDRLPPGIRVHPVYNRWHWNFTTGSGEIAYAANYDISDQDGHIDGILNEDDAKAQYPQGHGDAWGHYLSALKGYYRLLRNPNFTWVPRSEATLVGGVPVAVDYLDERRFAKAAAARARTGAEIAGLTYRQKYTDNPAGQWQGYRDPIPDRAWGVSEWTSRAGQGAYFDWVMANAMVPETYTASYKITLATLTQAGTDAAYDLTADVIDNGLTQSTIGMPEVTRDRLRAIQGAHVGRQNYLDDLEQALGASDAERYRFFILDLSQTSGMPESVFLLLETLKDKLYPSATALGTAVQETIGDDYYQTYYATKIAPFIQVPSGDPPEGIQKIDRTTVPELREIAASFQAIQEELDKADLGLNPLGLSRMVVPFDINPGEVDQGTTHFEQVYERAVQAMNNAIAVFNHANNSTQNLRRQSDQVAEFEQTVIEREADFNSRLIEIFGTPYLEDIGIGGAFPAGYTGPDLYHYTYVDRAQLSGEPSPPASPFVVPFRTMTVSDEGGLIETGISVTYHVAQTSYELVKPAHWTLRRAPGAIQRALSDLIQGRTRLVRALVEYDGLLSQIEDEVALLAAQQGVNASEIRILNEALGQQESLNDQIRQSRQLQLGLRAGARAAVLMANALAEFLPRSVGLSTDVTAPGRGAIRLVGSIVSEGLTVAADVAQLGELDHQQAKEIVQAQTNIRLTTNRQEIGVLQQVAQIEQLVRREALVRLEMYNLQEALQQAAGTYLSTLARGQRLIEDRLRFRQQTAAKVQAYRYKDMAFRIFRNDALQKYRAQFDTAAMYVYLAAKAYDFETNLRPYDPAHPGTNFFNKIVRARTIGLISNGEPQLGGAGDPGLADPMAQMFGNFGPLKTQLGFNNPQPATRDFSLRSQLLRIQGGSLGNAEWREVLKRSVITHLPDLPEFRRFCLFQASQPLEPGMVIPFSTTIDQDLNFFGWPAGAGDSSYNPEAFANKVRSVGISFINYKTSGGAGLKENVYVYLIPVGEDVMRSPRVSIFDDLNYTREWKIIDQWLPIPFPITDQNVSRIEANDWIPIYDISPGQGDFAQTRSHAPFEAWHDALSAGYDRDDPQFQSARLIGRSVWNTRWLLVVPAVSLLSDRDEAVARFIDGAELPDGSRDGNGISDIRIRIESYAYTGR